MTRLLLSVSLLRLVALVAALATSGPTVRAEPEPVAISGRVVEIGSERPLAGARVRTQAGEATTDADGRFRLELPAGTWALEVEAAGHLPDVVTISVGAEAPPELVILLIEKDRFSETVVVTADATPAAGRPILRARPIDVMMQAGSVDNVFRSLQTLAGVAAANEFESRLSVRGGGPDQNLTVMDGIEIHNPYRLFGLTSAFNPEIVSDFELSTGAFSVRYGDRLSSMLSVRNRAGSDEESLGGSASLSITDANVVLEGALPGQDTGSWLLTGRRTYYDLVAERIVDQDLPSFADLQGKLVRSVGPGRQLSFTGLLSRESTDGSFTEDDGGERGDILTAASNDLLAVSFDATLGSGGSSRTVAAWYRFVDSLDFDGVLESDYKVSNTSDSTPSKGFADVIFRRDIEVHDLSLRQELLLLPSPRHLVDAGLEVHSLDTRWGWQIPGERNPTAGNGSSVQGGAGLPSLLDSQVDSTRFGAWLSDRFQASDRLEIEAGLRLEHSTLVEQTTFSPRASARFDVSTETRLRAAIGVHTQSPGYEKQYQADYFVDLSDATGLTYERSTHYLLGLEHAFGPGLEARVEGYYKSLSDLIVGRLESEQERAERVATYDFPDDLASSVPTDPEITSFPSQDSLGRAWGVDVYVAKRATGPTTTLTGWLSYTWGRTDRDAYGRRAPFDYDRRHALNIVANWRFGRHFDLGVTGRFASGFPYTSARDVRAVAVEDPDRPGTLIPDEDAEGNLVWGIDPGGAGNLNDARLPSYARLDARLTYRPRGLSGRWLIYVEVLNVTNRENVAAVDYTIRFDDAGEPFIAQIQQQGGLPLLPTFGVRFRF